MTTLALAMTGVNETIVGVMHASPITPACRQQVSPCVDPNDVLYYVTTGSGYNFRLIFQNGTLLNFDERKIMAYGLLVMPSTFVSNRWSPALHFVGDVYVVTIDFYIP